MKLSIYLNSEGSLDKLLKEAEKKLNKEETLKIEKILLKLIKEVNPQTKVYKSKANKLLVIKILKYLSEKKTNKQSVDPIEVFYLLKEYYSKDPLYQYLFEKESNLTNNEVFYLEIIIPFLYDKNISLIINMLKNYLKEEDINFIREEITEINLRSYKGFIFLRKIILCVINSNGNLKQNFQDMKKNYLDNEQNEFLRCNKCFNFPMLFLDANKKISIKYSCEHLGEKEILKPEMIQNTKPKCSNCEKYLFETYKNLLCSNCKNIFCKDCLQIHFKKCLSLFFADCFYKLFDKKIMAVDRINLPFKTNTRLLIDLSHEQRKRAINSIMAEILNYNPDFHEICMYKLFIRFKRNTKS